MDKNKKQEHLQLLAEAFFNNIEYNEGTGDIGLDGKRPFGNSDIQADVLEIIKVDPEEEYHRDEYIREPYMVWSNEQREYASELFNQELVPYLRKYSKWLKFFKNTSQESLNKKK